MHAAAVPLSRGWRAPGAPHLSLIVGAIMGVLPALSAPRAQPAEAVRLPVTPSAGCGQPGARTGAFTLRATDGNHRARTYLIQVPMAYSATRAYPLVFVFHGAGGSSRDSYSWGLQRATGAAEGAIFVFPDGIEFQKYGVGWDDSVNGYDLAFFDDMSRDVSAHYCVDSKRVFIAGFSWGGDFAIALACQRGASILRPTSRPRRSCYDISTPAAPTRSPSSRVPA